MPEASIKIEVLDAGCTTLAPAMDTPGVMEPSVYNQSAASKRGSQGIGSGGDGIEELKSAGCA